MIRLLMRSLYDRLPDPWKPWVWRYRRRLTVLTFLVLLYGGVHAVDWILDNVLLNLPVFQSGPLKMTRRHFQAPAESVFTWTNMNRFLDEVTRNKPGILAHKWPYILLMILYLGLSVMVFIKLTEPDELGRAEDQQRTLPGETGPPDQSGN
jgi:hypothetical protein